MLERYDKKRIRVTLADGAVISGTAAHNPSGYGLHIFDRAEESLSVGGVCVFRSDIRRIEEITDSCPRRPENDPRRFDLLMGELLEGPYCVADVLPEQVPRDAPGQYFAVEQYYLRPERLLRLRRKFASILLRLNCYDDMTVSFDSCESWEENPEPEAFAARLEAMAGNSFLRAVFAERRSMIDVEPDDTYMTVYAPPPDFRERLEKLAAAEGLFVWSPPEGEE